MARPAVREQAIMECPGLITNVNTDTISPGALQQAQNVCIRRPNVIEHRRSMAQVNQVLLASSPKSFFTYGTSLYLSTADGKVTRYDKTGSLGVVTNERTSANLTLLNRPDGGGFAELNGNCYLADTVVGLSKMSSSTTQANVGSPNVGAPRALDLTLTAPNPGTGFLTAYYAVAYRLVWKYIDANNNVVRGVPSGRFVFVNGATATNVAVKSLMPAVVTSDGAAPVKWFYELYRTTATIGSATSAAPDPGDTVNLVYEGAVTATDVANKFVQVTDIYPETIVKGADLYTNATQEGIAQANYTPPICQDIVSFKGSLFAANTKSRQRATATMLGVPDFWSVTGMVWNLGSRQITLTLATTPTVAVAPDLTGLDNTCYVSLRGFVNASNNNSFQFVSSSGPTNLVLSADVAQTVPVTEAPPAGTTAMVGRLTIAAFKVHLYHHTAAPTHPTEIAAGNAVIQVPVAGTPSQQVSTTAVGIVNAMNVACNANFASVYAYYSSGPTDAPGIIQFEEAVIGGATFSVAVIGTAFGNKFSPSLTSALVSSNDASVARVYFTKPNQPESWPLVNYFDIGSKASAIIRIIANRESIFVFKVDGLYRISGDGVNWYVRRFDDTVRLVTTAAACLMHNVVYAITTRGIMAITEYGTQIVSMPVANIVAGSKNVLGINTGFTERAIPNEIDNCVYFDVYPTTPFGLIYSLTTGAWTQSTSEYISYPGIYFHAEGVVYRGHSDNFMLAREVKQEFRPAPSNADGQYSRYDTAMPADRYWITLTAAADQGNGVYLVTSDGLNNTFGVFFVGDVLRQQLAGGLNKGTCFWVVTSLVDEFNAYVQRAPWDSNEVPSANFAAGICEGYRNIPVFIEWNPFGAGDSSAANRFVEASILLDRSGKATDADYRQLGSTTIVPGAAGMMSFASETDQTFESVTFGSVVVANNLAAALKRGNPSYELRTLVPLKKSRCRRLTVAYQHTGSCLEFMSIIGISFKWVDYSQRDKQGG